MWGCIAYKARRSVGGLKKNCLKSKLVKICQKHLASKTSAVVREPYIPFIPKKWNGVFVLAESQNLSKKNASYVAWLNGLSDRDIIKRLYLRNSVDIQPWDDRSLKLAVEALRFQTSETAVCNAVLWSQRGKNDENDNPDEDLQKASAALWKELLHVLNPALVICCGKIAEGVITGTGWEGKTLSWRLPSPVAMSRISGMFDEYDLLARYSEVARVIKKHPEWITGYKKNKIFFACHAVSLTRANKVKIISNHSKLQEIVNAKMFNDRTHLS